MAYFTSGEVDAAITTTTRIGLVGSATTTASSFGQYEKWARSDVQAAAQVAGYSLGDTTSNDTIKRLAIAKWYSLAASIRSGIPIPDEIREQLFRLEQLRLGQYPIPGLTPSSRDGVGGSKFSSQSETSTSGRTQFMSRSKLFGW